MGFLALDRNSVASVVAQLQSHRDLVALQLACRELHDLISHNSFWLPLLSSVFALELQGSAGLHAKGVYRDLFLGTFGTGAVSSSDTDAAGPSSSRVSLSLSSKSSPTRRPGYPVRFHALYTDGGMDDNNMVYWVDNMYMPNGFGAYCSEIAPNVNTLALLKGPADPYDQQQRDHRLFLISRLASPALRLFGRSHLLRLLARTGGLGSRRYEETEVDMEATAMRALRNWALPGLQQFYVDMYQAMQAGVHLGSLLRSPHASDLASEDARLRAHYLYIQAARRGGNSVSDAAAASILGYRRGASWHDSGMKLVDRACLREVQRRLGEAVHLSPPTAPPGSTLGGAGLAATFPSAGPASGKGAQQADGRATRVALVHRLSVSRAGDFTCPVRCGAVFLGSLPTASALGGLTPGAASAASEGSCQAAPGSYTAPSAAARTLGDAQGGAGGGSGLPSWQQQQVARDWPQWDQLQLPGSCRAAAGISGVNSISAGAPSELQDAVAIDVVGAWACQASVKALDSLCTTEEVVEKVQAGLLPRILQYRWLSNGEWIEFEAVQSQTQSQSSRIPGTATAEAPSPTVLLHLTPHPEPTNLSAAASPTGTAAAAVTPAASLAAATEQEGGGVQAPASLATLLAPKLSPIAWFRFYTREELRRRRLAAQASTQGERQAQGQEPAGGQQPGQQGTAIAPPPGEGGAAAGAPYVIPEAARAPGFTSGCPASLLGRHLDSAGRSGGVGGWAAPPTGAAATGSAQGGEAAGPSGLTTASAGAGEAAAGIAGQGAAGPSADAGVDAMQEGSSGGLSVDEAMDSAEAFAQAYHGDSESDAVGGAGSGSEEGEEGDENGSVMAANADGDAGASAGGGGNSDGDGGSSVSGGSESSGHSPSESEEDEEDDDSDMDGDSLSGEDSEGLEDAMMGVQDLEDAMGAAAAGMLGLVPPPNWVGMAAPPQGPANNAAAAAQWQIVAHEQVEAEAIMTIFNSVLMSVGAMCIRQMQRAVHETAQRLRRKWDQEDLARRQGAAAPAAPSPRYPAPADAGPQGPAASGPPAVASGPIPITSGAAANASNAQQQQQQRKLEAPLRQGLHAPGNNTGATGSMEAETGGAATLALGPSTSGNATASSSSVGASPPSSGSAPGTSGAVHAASTTAAAPHAIVLREDPNYLEVAPELAPPASAGAGDRGAVGTGGGGGLDAVAAQAQAAAVQTLARNSSSLLQLELRQVRCGNMAAVKLIHMEDRMEDYGDEHDHVNVDCQFVAFQGYIVDLPAQVQLRG